MRRLLGLPMRLLRRAARMIPHPSRQLVRAWRLRAAAAWAQGLAAPRAADEGRVLQADCRLCGQAQAVHRVVGQVDATHTGPFEVTSYTLLHCESCDVVYLSPAPSARDLDTLYRQSDQYTDACYAAAATIISRAP